MNLDIGDVITRRMPGFNGRYWDYPGMVTEVIEDTITGTFIVDQPRVMSFDRKTGINVRGYDYGWIKEIAGDDPK